LAAAVVLISSTRNPLYLTLALLCVAFVGMVVRAQPASTSIPLPILRMGIVIVVLSTIFNALIVHYGKTVLFTIPGQIPLLSGPVTLESALYGFLNGLVLAGFLAVFAILNQALPVQALIRWIPRAFYPVAVVVTIAITYVPATLRQMGQLREAQSVRGHRWRGWRDWLALFMPLLVNGLERAMSLTEAMMARGFAAADPSDQHLLPRFVLSAGSMFLVGGWLMRAIGWQAGLGLAFILLGMLSILGALWQVGQRVPRSTYRQEHWQGVDWLTLGGALLSAAVFLLPLPGIDQTSLDYYPYPQISLPGFHPLLGLAVCGLLGPGIALVWQIIHKNRAASPSEELL
jgi:energy-coupling factor transport system permease protein